MSADHLGHDPVLAAIADLRPHDVSAGHADRLRSRCHGVLDEAAATAIGRHPRSLACHCGA